MHIAAVKQNQIAFAFCGLVLAAAFFFVFVPHASAQGGMAVRSAADGTYYLLLGDRKRSIADERLLAALGFDAASVTQADAEILARIPDVRVVKIAAEPAVYDITSGHRVAITSPKELSQKGFSFEEIAVVTMAELAQYPLPGEGAVPTSVVDDTSAVGEPVPAPVSALLQKIEEARQLLRAAPLLYPQQKTIVSSRSLHMGAEGPDVEAVQTVLQKLGYFPMSVEVNGTFGPTTQKAVKAFQKAKGIIQNGTVGPQTRAALEKNGLAATGKGMVVHAWRDAVPEDRDVLLAVWNQATGDLRQVRITLDSHTVKKGKKFVTTYTTVSKTPDFGVRYVSGNGVNVQYAITSPTGYRVLANRFPIFTNTTNGIGDFPATEEVYVPYSDSLRTDEVVASGRTYLDATVDRALADLRAKGIVSASGSGLVADNVDPEELKNLAIIEHMDVSEFSKAADKRTVVNRILAVIGLNREETFRFSGSPKGALGIAQFIKKSYAGIRARYPGANLIVDFQAGMADHVNAFKAMALYQDASGSTLTSYVRDNVTSDPAALLTVMGEVRAAAYNGGPGRVKTAVKKYGADWQTATSRKYGLFAETKSYVQKFRVVRDVLAIL